MRDAYRVWLEKPEGMGPLARYRLWWECDIKMNLHIIDWGRGVERSDAIRIRTSGGL
jgi:hypothetical protein